MERFVKGDVVVLLFPFSDYSAGKKRPAFVLANLKGEDLILCQITSQLKKDQYTISLNNEDFAYGTLNKPSNIRPNRIFTAKKNMIVRKIGTVKQKTTDQVINKLIDLLKN